MSDGEEVCPGCGLVTARSDGPTHAYIGASAGCWAAYGALLARGGAGQLGVDAYAAQHPGVEERRSVQSVAVHLMSLCAALERGSGPQEAVQLIRRVLDGPRGWTWLAPKTPIGTVTVDGVVAGTVDPFTWAADVWQAWSPHHETVRGWLDDAQRA